MSKKEMTDLNNNFDFGFIAVTETELESYKTAQNEKINIQSEAEKWEFRAREMRRAIEPLLVNLCQEPNKEYLLWPNRAEIVAAFKQRLNKILED